MKAISRLTFTALVFCLAGNLIAQDMNTQIAFTRAQDEADRQAIVAGTLDLSPAESTLFWPLYRDYRAEMSKVGDRAWKLLIDFADKYEAMSEADASRMLDEVLAIEKEQNATKTKWMKSMRKSLPAVTVARFYQIDNKIDTLLRLDAAASVPLVQGQKK